MKNSKLVDVEMEVTLLQLRKAILQAQGKDLKESTIKLSDSYVRMFIHFLCVFCCGWYHYLCS